MCANKLRVLSCKKGMVLKIVEEVIRSAKTLIIGNQLLEFEVAD
jgi:hypothetical protein